MILILAFVAKNAHAKFHLPGFFRAQYNKGHNDNAKLGDSEIGQHNVPPKKVQVGVFVKKANIKLK